MASGRPKCVWGSAGITSRNQLKLVVHQLQLTAIGFPGRLQSDADDDVLWHIKPRTEIGFRAQIGTVMGRPARRVGLRFGTGCRMRLGVFRSGFFDGL